MAAGSVAHRSFFCRSYLSLPLLRCLFWPFFFFGVPPILLLFFSPPLALFSLSHCCCCPPPPFLLRSCLPLPLSFSRVVFGHCLPPPPPHFLSPYACDTGACMSPISVAHGPIFLLALVWLSFPLGACPPLPCLGGSAALALGVLPLPFAPPHPTPPSAAACHIVLAPLCFPPVFFLVLLPFPFALALPPFAVPCCAPPCCLRVLAQWALHGALCCAGVSCALCVHPRWCWCWWGSGELFPPVDMQLTGIDFGTLQHKGFHFQDPDNAHPHILEHILEHMQGAAARQYLSAMGIVISKNGSERGFGWYSWTHNFAFVWVKVEFESG